MNVVKFLFKPFDVAIRELKINKKTKEELIEKGYNLTSFYPFIQMNYMVLAGYAVIYAALAYYLIIGIMTYPLALVAFAVTAVVLGIGTFFHATFYPETRENYLNSIGFYNRHRKKNKRSR
jgi:hypothetical protein